MCIYVYIYILYVETKWSNLISLLDFGFKTSTAIMHHQKAGAGC